MPIIAIANQKGGVGKTIISFNLSKGLAQRNFSTLAVDNDPQGNLTSSFLKDPTTLSSNILKLYQEEAPKINPQKVEKNLDLIGTNIRLAEVADSNFEVIFQLKESLNTISKNYDFVLIDCVPSFGYLNMAALLAADFVLIPTKPDKYTFEGLTSLFNTVKKIQKRFNHPIQILGLILNLVEGRKTKAHEGFEKSLREVYGDLVLEPKLHRGIKLEESPSFNQSVMEYEPKGKPALQFNNFIEEFLRRIKNAQKQINKNNTK